MNNEVEVNENISDPYGRNTIPFQSKEKHFSIARPFAKLLKVPKKVLLLVMIAMCIIEDKMPVDDDTIFLDGFHCSIKGRDMYDKLSVLFFFTSMRSLYFTLMPTILFAYGLYFYMPPMLLGTYLFYKFIIHLFNLKEVKSRKYWNNTLL